jgi:uncharacterized protein (DUF1330 family)
MQLPFLARRASAGAACLLLSTAALAGEALLVDSNARGTAGFVLMQAEMTDQQSFFTRYAVPAEVVVSANGGRAQVATFGKTVLEGQWNNNWTIMLRFPSVQAASTWYHSAAYQALIPYRKAATAYGNMVLFEGTPESVLNWQVARYEGATGRVRPPQTLDPTPEYVVSLDSIWNKGDARVAAGASFAPVDARGARLAVEVKLPAGYAGNLQLRTLVWLRDTAGRRRALGQWPAGQFVADKWQKLVAEIHPLHRDGSIDLAAIDAVELEFATEGKATLAPATIQIRNLKLTR